MNSGNLAVFGHDWFSRFWQLSTASESSHVTFGVALALLAMCILFMYRRAQVHARQADAAPEPSLFPPTFSYIDSLAPAHQGDSAGSLAQSSESIHEEIDTTEAHSMPVSPSRKLTLVDPLESIDPYAFMRKLTARESLDLAELERRCNSLNLIIQTSSFSGQSTLCFELLALVEQIIIAARQRLGTVELLLDDAEPESVAAARELLEQPLHVPSTAGAHRRQQVQGDWIQGAHALLEEAELALRQVAVG